MSGLSWPAPYTSCLKLIFLISSHQSSHFSCHKGFLPNFMDHLPNPLLRATTHQRAQSRNLQNFPSPAGSFYPKPLKTASQGPCRQLLSKTIKNSFPRTFPSVLLPREHRDQHHPCMSQCPIDSEFQEKFLCLWNFKISNNFPFLLLFYYYYYFKVFSPLQFSHHLKFLLWMLHF